jgi:hypothetical protein
MIHNRLIRHVHKDALVAAAQRLRDKDFLITTDEMM